MTTQHQPFRIDLSEYSIMITAPAITGSGAYAYAPEPVHQPMPSHPPGAHVAFPPIEPPADLVGQEPAGIRIAPTWAPGGIPDLPLPIGMIEPVDPTAALAAEAALDDIIRNAAPRSPSLLARFIPSTATAFWMAVAATLALLLARAEGWL